MNNEQKLLELVQPPEYISKIKLYCPYSDFSVKKFAQLEIKPYIHRILITDL